MIQITPYGFSTFLKAMTGKVKRMHLFVENGELSGHGYMPIEIMPDNWDNGRYPEQTWEFEAGEPADVMGYYTTDASGQILFTEMFETRNEMNEVVPAPARIKNNGDRISVAINLNMLGAPA